MALMGLSIGSLTLLSLFFADDGLLVASSWKQAKQLLDVMTDAAGRCGFEMNVMKSK